MLLKDYCEKLLNDYKRKGYKDVKVIETTTCQIGKTKFCITLFGESTVPMETEVSEDRSMLPDNIREFVPGVQIAVSYIKPRYMFENYDFKELRIVQ